MYHINQVQMLRFPQHGDERGHLAIIEGGVDIPFEIKRAFYIYGMSGNAVRGQHANRKSEFVLISVAGTSRIRVRDGGGNEAVYCLDKPDVGIYIPKMIWKDMYEFSEGAVMLALSNEHYDSGEYIRDYGVFVKEALDETQN